MAPNLLVSIHPVSSRMNTRKRNQCHIPLIGNYSSASKCLLVRECFVAFGWYHTTGSKGFVSKKGKVKSFIMRLAITGKVNDIAILYIYINFVTGISSNFHGL